MIRLTSVATLLVAATACGGGDPVAGQQIYSSTCAACHGPDGKLGIDTTGVPAADLTVRIPAITDDDITNDVNNGIRTMAPVPNIDDAQMQDLIAYLRDTFGP